MRDLSRTLRILPGVIGMLLVMIGVGWSRPALQAWLCLFGTLGMTLTAGLERHILFLVLNAVVLAGNLAAFTNFPALIKSLIPLSVAAPTLLFLIQAKLLPGIVERIGATALIFLALGYAVQHPLGYFAGGVLVSLYSWCELRRGFSPALLWLVLNLLFALIAGRQLIGMVWN